MGGLAKKLIASTGDEGKLYVDDVFSTYLYTGNGGTQTINNGIDLAGKGGLVWIKSRSGTSSTTHPTIFDTQRGVNRFLFTSLTNGSSNNNPYGVSNFSGSGFSVTDDTAGSFGANGPSTNYVSWTFRKAPKFFDVVTYTGNGTTQNISHSLGITPGMVIVKCINSTGNWLTWHRGLSAGNYITLNGTAAQASAGAATAFGNNTTTVDPTNTVLTVGSAAEMNANGGTYVAYLFAHDPSEDGIIQCGSYTGNGSTTGPVINLGWEPQFVLTKRTDSTSGADWYLVDAMRGMSLTGTTELRANAFNADNSLASQIAPTATGYQLTGTAAGFNALNGTYIYLAIRRPNKPPKSGTEVYNAIARTGTGAAATVTGVGFTPDLVFGRSRTAGLLHTAFVNRLVGRDKYLWTSSTNAEGTSTVTQDVTGFDVMDGIRYGIDNGVSLNAANSVINYFMRRATGFMDEVCYTGTGVARTVNHNLGVVPELMIFKSRNDSTRTTWNVWHTITATTACRSSLYQTSAQAGPATYATFGNFTGPPTASGIPLSTVEENFSGNTNVAYLFATKTGISKVGSYTGNGSSQTIDCGFTTGARFVMIKRTDSTGGWYVWDTARGIVAANDPHLSLNTTAAEVTTDDSVDPESSGFIVNQNTATNINVNGGSYIFLAIA